MEYIIIQTEIVNKWWDALPHSMKEHYISKMKGFNWGAVISTYAISKNQKNDLYQQVHNINGKKLK